MTDDMLDLARRAVACKGWRFMGGMLVSDAIGKQRIYDDVAGEPYWSADGWLPDLTDPATLGCLLALVREAWGPDHILETRQFRTFGEVYVGEGRCFVHPTLAEALVAALEVAP